MHRRLEIRDPIHGFIYREPDERDIMDTRVFQRLRRLKQPALALLVYPGATHSRFDRFILQVGLAKLLTFLRLREDSFDLPPFCTILGMTCPPKISPAKT